MENYKREYWYFEGIIEDQTQAGPGDPPDPYFDTSFIGQMREGMKSLGYAVGIRAGNSFDKTIFNQGIHVYGSGKNSPRQDIGSKRSVKYFQGLDLTRTDNILSLFGLLGNTHAIGTAVNFDYVFNTDPRVDYIGTWPERVSVWQQDKKTGLYESLKLNDDKWYRYDESENRMYFVGPK